MVFRITAGLWFVFEGLYAVGFGAPELFLDILAIIAGIALLAGI